jgi:hypothetical protein
MYDLTSDPPMAEHTIARALATARWVKSSYSGPTGGNCVEVAGLGDGLVAVRDSRRTTGPALVFPVRAWCAFIGQVGTAR